MSEIVAERVVTIRKGAGLTRADLAARCRDLGLPTMSTASLANIETGRPGADGIRRREVSVDELAVLSAALAVPPLALLLPLGIAPTVDVLPNVPTCTDRALEWFTQGWAPDGVPEISELARKPLLRVATHAAFVATLRKIEAELAGLAESKENEADLRVAAVRTWGRLLLFRVNMERDGQMPPALPPDLAAREAAEGGPTTTGSVARAVAVAEAAVRRYPPRSPEGGDPDAP